MLSKIITCLSVTSMLAATPVLIGLATPASAAPLSVAQDDVVDDVTDDDTDDGQVPPEAPEPTVYQDTDAELSVSEGSLEDDDEPSIALIAGAFVVLAAAVALGFWRFASRSGHAQVEH